jgi:hypothetical protein
LSHRSVDNGSRSNLDLGEVDHAHFHKPQAAPLGFAVQKREDPLGGPGISDFIELNQQFHANQSPGNPKESHD